MHPFAAKTMTALLRGRAAAEPERLALRYLAEEAAASGSLTYRDLDERARAIAAGLAGKARPGDRALLLYPPGLDFVAAFFACAYAGIVAVPAYPPRNRAHFGRLSAIIRDSAPTLALTNAKTRSGMRVDAGEAPEFGALTWICTDEIPDSLADEWRETIQDGDALAFLQYTSGSTGAPKGVRVSHANILYNSLYIQQSFQLHSGSVSACWLPSFHDMGLIDGVIQPVYGGFPGLLLSPAAFIQKPARWLEAISEHRATHAGGPNFGYDLCVRKVTEEQKETLDLSSWESAYNGAEPVRAATLRSFARAFRGCGFRPRALYPCYGMAEATLMVTGCAIDREPVIRSVAKAGLETGSVAETSAGFGVKSVEIVSSGRAILDTRVRVVDPDTGEPVAPERVGEVWVAGPAVCQGYWGREEETRTVFAAHIPGEATPWLRTGDLGFLNDGELFITGRLKDLIIVRGRNHYPQDVEWTAESAAPGLRSAAAFSVDVDEEERLIVVQELERHALKNPDVQGLGQAVADAISAEHEVQAHAVVLIKTGSLPKTSSGKLQRRACRARYLDGSLDIVGIWLNPAVGTAEPGESSAGGTARSRDAIRNWLACRIAARLKLQAESIDTSAEFARYGLDSASIISLSGELADWLGRAVAPTALYDFPSIEALSSHLGSGAAAMKPESPFPARTAPTDTAQPIAAIGIGCRFPGDADDPESFWRLLADGIDAIGEVPADRWAAADFHSEDPDAAGRMVSRHGGFLRQVDLFDPEFFGIAPREAAAMDPQQRLLLEVAWESLEHAGIAADRLAGAEAGVFVGLSTHDYADLQLAPAGAERVGAYAATGSSFSAAAGRISYLLGIHGPAVAVDTACSSSLVALHLACQSLRLGECGLALAGGANVILSPVLGINFSRARMMAPDGRCKAFDAAADGYVRSEGCGVVVLKRLDDAIAAGDRILGVVRGSAVGQDGRSNGLTAPNGPAQASVIRKALSRARLAPAEIDCVEAHGTGTALGDPIELQALDAALGEGRPASRPLIVGSVKSNIGHLEAAAGIAGFIKALLAVREGLIPASLHFHDPSPRVPWQELRLSVAGRPTPWPAVKRPRRMGVSSFGFTGTNAHVIVEEAPAPAHGNRVADVPRHVLAFSAQNEAALLEMKAAHARNVEGLPDQELADYCFTVNTGRAQFGRRIACTGAGAGELRSALALAPPDPIAGAAGAAFLFTGQGSQYPGMAGGLYRSEPVFRRAFDRCDSAFRSLRNESLHDLLFLPSGSASRLGETQYTQPALFAVAHGLVELWGSWGIRPARVLGHSVGEYPAACAAGVFSPEDGLALAEARGRLMQALPPGGGMIAVRAGAEEAAAAARGEPSVRIAAINGPLETVLSGPCAALDSIAAALRGRGIEALALPVSHAFHSGLMEPMLDAFDRVLSRVRFSPPRVPMLSNLTGGIAAGDVAGPGYWREQVLQPVRFMDGVRTLSESGIRHCIEIGPKPILCALAARSWKGREARWLPSLREGRDDPTVILGSLALLYADGFAVDWRGLHAERPRRRVSAPTYPFQRSRHWLEPAAVASAAPSSKVSQDTAGTPPEPASPAFGIMFFNGIEDPADTGKYRMVIESARYADRAGFASVWVPERHYTKFGSLYPNPSVLQAALARETRHLRLMAGSIVLPLHHPLRAAEDWSVVDNLSGGRVGLSFASGWNPDDFAMVPDRYAGRHKLLFEGIETVRKLWRGEAIDVRSGNGEPARVRIYPTPIQRELPVWVTAAGNPKTFERAGEIGANLLTHLLDQEIPDLAAKIRIYRDARARAAHDPAGGRVTLMVHTFLGEDAAQALERIRGPYCAFLKENIHLLKGLAFSRGNDVDLAALSPSDLDDFVGFLFERFSKTRALFGTPESCAPLVGRMLEAGVDEIACLLDFGPTTEQVLESLPHLERLKSRFLIRAAPRVMAPRPAAPAKQSGADEVKLDEILYRPEWRPVGVPRERRTLRGGTWLILDDHVGNLGRSVGELLAKSGARPVFVGMGDRFQRLPGGDWRVNPVEPEDFRRLVTEASEPGRPLEGVLHLWSLDLGGGAHTTLQTVQAGLTVGCASLLHLAQALDSERQPARIHLVTRGAQCAGRTAPVAVAQAPAWGLGRVIALEHPELWGGMIDLDPEGGPDEAACVFEELTSDDGEDQVAWREGRRRAARLIPSAAEAVAPTRFAGDAAYLVTGGLGGLGRRVGRWMAERGARHLVLTGLHPVPPRSEWEARATSAEASDRDRFAALLAIEAAGATVHARQADVTDPERMKDLFSEIDRLGLPLRGVIHLAGLSENRPIRETVYARDQAVFGPKVAGAWILHELVRARALDFFGAFSSIAAVWGSRGQPIYAAANHFLDALGSHRNAIGLPATIVNWGPWSEGGMVVSAADQAYLARMGVGTMRPPEAIQALDFLLASRRQRHVVARVDWRLFKDLFESRGRRPLLAELGNPDTEQSVRTAFCSELAGLEEGERRSRIAGWLNAEIGRVLGLKDGRPLATSRGFFELGMDSLMAIEVKNRLQRDLGIPLRATVVFNYSNVDDLAGYLGERVGDTGDVPAVESGENGGAGIDLEKLSPDELIKYLEREIGSTENGNSP